MFEVADQRSVWMKAAANGSSPPFLGPKAEQHPATLSLSAALLPPIQAVSRFPVHLSFHNVLSIIPERRAMEHVWPGIRGAGRVVRVYCGVKF
ncbi:MAG: hypothetical protein GTN62_09550 [Gemmatimonadales bacterium]|nr:hypothetical protein [Gemmatimonadales bacterium]NIN11783.1 hypothetical protein [Gemmatimonadales bacterium]NIN50339.1 hypothetical protein [Gemmatimonadales bacterium]NIP07803.1 hypothetical protein [Gemmatimonadales bacterium]NIQ99235.1 hypothetical protein [Gemmatimonadales bacterium]